MPPLPSLVARVPVLHGRVLDLGVVERDQLDHRGVQLVLVALRRRAALEVAHVAARVGDDQRALELAGAGGVDAEVGRQLHRAAHALRHVDERAVGEHRGVQRGEEVVALRHDRAEVAPHQLGVVLDRFRDRAEDDAELAELLLEGGGDRDAVEHVVHRDAGQHLLLPDRDAELLVGAQQLGIDLFQALRPVVIGLGRRIVADRLVVDRRVLDPRPARLLHRAPALERLEPPRGQPLGLALLGRDEAHDLVVQTHGCDVGLDLGDEAVLVLVPGVVAHRFQRSRHRSPSPIPPSRR